MQPDRLVAEIGEIARKHEGLSMLAGFVADGAQPDQVRLYLRPEMDWYVEFPEKAVAHRMPLPKETSFVGGSLLWVVPGTELTDVRSSSLAEQAAFMRGSLMDTQIQEEMDDAAMAMAWPATVLASSGLCALTVVGTIVVTTITIASYNMCTTSVNTPTLNSALMSKQCVGVTTNATVICHPQTRTMTGGEGNCGGGGGGRQPAPDDDDKGPILA